MRWLSKLKDVGEETRLGNSAVGEVKTSPGVMRLDEGMGPSRGSTVAFVPVRNVDNGCERSPRDRRCRELLRVAGCAEATADES